MHAQSARTAKRDELKLSNKSRLEKLKKSHQVIKWGTKMILAEPKNPRSEIRGQGPILMLPDNGHRFPNKKLLFERE